MNRLTVLFSILCATASATDPSLSPLPSPGGDATFEERFRIVTDLDGDGVKDLLLSAGRSSFGTMGGTWTVFFRRGDTFRKAGEITAHPMAIAIEPDRDRHSASPENRYHCRIWIYLKGGGSSGSLGYYRMAEKAVEKSATLEIWPGDGGTSLGNSLYNSIFRDSREKLPLETSTTSPEGIVRWSAAE